MSVDKMDDKSGPRFVVKKWRARPCRPQTWPGRILLAALMAPACNLSCLAPCFDRLAGTRSPSGRGTSVPVRAFAHPRIKGRRLQRRKGAWPRERMACSDWTRHSATADTCAICRNKLYEPSIEAQASKRAPLACCPPSAIALLAITLASSNCGNAGRLTISRAPPQIPASPTMRGTALLGAAVGTSSTWTASRAG